MLIEGAPAWKKFIFEENIYFISYSEKIYENININKSVFSEKISDTAKNLINAPYFLRGDPIEEEEEESNAEEMIEQQGILISYAVNRISVEPKNDRVRNEIRSFDQSNAQTLHADYEIPGNFTGNNKNPLTSPSSFNPVLSIIP